MATVVNVDLPEGIFGIQPNVPVMHQVVTAQLAAARSGTHSTKSRAEVSRRRGQALAARRAPAGPARAPPGRPTGGAAAWPTAPSPAATASGPRRRWSGWRCDRPCPTGRAEGMVTVVDDWGFAAPKTKDAVAALKAIGVAAGERVLVVLDRADKAGGAVVPQPGGSGSIS